MQTYSSLVYKFSCACCASEYVGSTIRTLHTRVAEHAGRSFNYVPYLINHTCIVLCLSILQILCQIITSFYTDDGIESRNVYKI